MRVGAIGRSRLLLDAITALASSGHQIAFIHTSPGEGYYGVDELDFRALADRIGAPFICDRKVASCLKADLGGVVEVAISVNWPTLIPATVREAFAHGILNAHAGDLPRYRGNACPNWAILNFEPRVALTVHRMTETLDSGPWLEKEWLDIDETTYIGDIYRWLEMRTPAVFVKAIDRLASEGFREVDQEVRPSRMFPRRPEDARIDWKAPNRSVLALIRASSHPFDGAFSYLEGDHRIRIFRARPFEPGYDFAAVPGQVCMRHSGHPVIATGDGMIEIEECAGEGLDNEAAAALITRSLRNRLL